MSERTIVSIRLDNEQLDLLLALAELDNTTTADQIRDAVGFYISSRASEKAEIKAKIVEIKKKRDSRLRKLLGSS
ncbi:MAG: hypothetical protein HYY86_01165 [Candidatus Harrisonbacteria bacterium]|nr:hypothetical protein [Candidatus Harrisonbacteria bacterium]